MAIRLRNGYFGGWLLAVVAAMVLTPLLYAGNQVMGEITFEGKSKVEKTSGVWVDGQYVGYLKELKGSKRVMLLPGEHTITVRQDGYQDFVQRVSLQPGEKRMISVVMQHAATGPMPSVTSTVKISVNPNRAAVFLDGLFVGHVGEFEGAGRGLLVAPGSHTIKIALPGYETFETQIAPQPRQKVEVKTDLIKSENPGNDPLLNGRSSDSVTPSAPQPASSTQRMNGGVNNQAPSSPAVRSGSVIDNGQPPPPEQANPPQPQ